MERTFSRWNGITNYIWTGSRDRSKSWPQSAMYHLKIPHTHKASSRFVRGRMVVESSALYIQQKLYIF